MSRRYAKAGLLRRGGRGGIGASGEGSPPVVIDPETITTTEGLQITDVETGVPIKIVAGS